jgi:16S rRNA (guanine527-N7)-methyltransferase
VRRLDDAELAGALALSQRFGMLGSAPIDEVIQHSASFLGPLVAVSGRLVDLGTGGGVPGLVIAWMRNDLDVVLVDRRASRTDHLRRLVQRLGLGDHVRVLTADARSLPRLLEAPVDAVVARGFGSPPVVLAAATPILAADGVIVISAPPAGSAAIWTAELAATYGLVQVESDARLVTLRRLDASRETSPPPGATRLERRDAGDAESGSCFTWSSDPAASIVPIEPSA